MSAGYTEAGSQQLAGHHRFCDLSADLRGQEHAARQPGPEPDCGAKLHAVVVSCFSPYGSQDAHLGLDYSPILVLGAAECPNTTNVTELYVQKRQHGSQRITVL